MFLTATQGLADKVSCNHFRVVSQKHKNVLLKDVQEEKHIASIMLQTSKWVKNSVQLSKIFWHIKNELNGQFPKDLHFLTKFHLIGTKTASLFLWLAFSIHTVVPVDMHAKLCACKLGLANTQNTDEIAWQLVKFVPPSKSGRFNDVCGSLRQKMVSDRLGAIDYAAKQHPMLLPFLNSTQIKIMFYAVINL